MSQTDSPVIVYTRPGCPYCAKLRAGLKASKLRHREVDIWQDPRAAAFVREVADGNETVPTVDVAGYAMVNPRVRDVLAAVAERAPEHLPEPKGRGPWWRRAR